MHTYSPKRPYRVVTCTRVLNDTTIVRFILVGHHDDLPGDFYRYSEHGTLENAKKSARDLHRTVCGRSPWTSTCSLTEGADGRAHLIRFTPAPALEA